MLLAEALIEKKELNARISELQRRYTAVAILEEGNQPDENPDDLLQSLNGAFARWEELTVQINQANNRIMVPGSSETRTMMQCLAHRDSLKSQTAHFGAITTAVRQRNSGRRYYGETNAPKMIVAEGVDVKGFIKLVDDLNQELRILDTAIQAANWQNELEANV